MGEGDFVVYVCSLMHYKGASPLCLLAAVLLFASWPHTLLLRLSDLQCDAMHAEFLISHTQGAPFTCHSANANP